jgi:hypothetical protein
MIVNWIPESPCSPGEPALPTEPIGPADPAGPCCPEGPGFPIDPCWPVAPVSPVAPIQINAVTAPLTIDSEQLFAVDITDDASDFDLNITAG